MSKTSRQDLPEVIEATPLEATPVEEPGERPEPTAPERRSGGGGFALFLAFVALLAAGGTAAGGYWLWQQFEKQKVTLQGLQGDRREAAAIDQLVREQRDLRGRLSGLALDLDGLSQGLRAQADQITSLRAAAASTPTERPDLATAEAGFLLHLAEQQLALGRDPAGALASLEAADRRLAEGGGELMPTRAALAREIEALRGVSMPDRGRIAAAIGELAAHIDALPLSGDSAPRYQPPAAPDRKAPLPWEDWSGFVEVVKTDLLRLVTIRHGDAARLPLAGPEQQFFLRQNLLFKLDLARLALLEGRGDLYRQSLREAAQWLDRYADAGDPAVAPILGQLRQLADQPVDPPLPPLGAARAALERARVNRPPAPLVSREPPRVQAPRAAEPAVESPGTAVELPAGEPAAPPAGGVEATP